MGAQDRPSNSGHSLAYFLSRILSHFPSMAEEEGSWDSTVDEWLCSEGYCCAGALAQGSYAFFYAAAPVEGEAGWAIVYKEDHEETVLMEDGSTEKKMTINEPANLLHAVNTGKKPEGGLWLGGERFGITQYLPSEEIAEKSCIYLFANPRKVFTLSKHQETRSSLPFTTKRKDKC